MNEISKINDVVDTTDCLEAIGACKGMKNFMFIIVLVCLLLLQGIFWLNVTGNIDMGEEPVPTATADTPVPEAATEVPQEQSEKVDAVAKTVEEVQADKVVKEVAAEDNEVAEKPVADIAKEPAASIDEEPAASIDEEPATNKISRYFIPKHGHAVGLIRVCNFVLILTATLYSLVLLISLKVSMIGRLGGINHISRAFFLSLFALVILLPWQLLFNGFALGAIYASDELFNGWTLWGDTLMCRVFYYLRFSGLWLLALLLIMLAQCRSGRWARTTLKRLGVLR